MIKRFSNNLTLSRIWRIFGQAKFPKKKHCFACHFRKLYRLSDNRFKCQRCKKKFSLTTGTYLAKSKLSIDHWYELLWWFNYEFTAHKTAKEIDLPQRLVHRCFSVLRKAIYNYETKQMIRFFGKIEVDETYIGPKFRNRRKKIRNYYRKLNVVKRGRGAKYLQQPIFGLYQRNGLVYMEFVRDVEKKTLQEIIKGRVVLESDVYSDTFKSYCGLKKEGYRHQTVDHSKEEYLKAGKVHINGIEGFWAYLKEHLLKHHGVAKRNLIYYIKELEFRFNHRHLSTEEFIKKLIEILVSEKPFSLEETFSKMKLSDTIKSKILNQISLEKPTKNLVKIGPPND